MGARQLDTERSGLAAGTGIDTVRLSVQCERFPEALQRNRRKIMLLSGDARFGANEWHMDRAWLEFSAAKQEHGHNRSPLSRASKLGSIVSGLFGELEERGAQLGTTDRAVGHVCAQGRVGASPVRSSMIMVMNA